MAGQRQLKYKQAIILRTDLKMGCGKKCVQASHAAVSAARLARSRAPANYRAWMAEGQRKIVLKVDGLEALRALARKAEEAGLPHFLVADAGLTQLEPGTVTALGVGPAPEEAVDKICGQLKLL
ncbi:MAG: aminoacyl-tRNA hydrolase [Promethearchaeota archaeon]